MPTLNISRLWTPKHPDELSSESKDTQQKLETIQASSVHQRILISSIKRNSKEGALRTQKRVRQNHITETLLSLAEAERK